MVEPYIKSLTLITSTGGWRIKTWQEPGIKDCYIAFCEKLGLCACDDSEAGACIGLSNMIEYEIEKKTKMEKIPENAVIKNVESAGRTWEIKVWPDPKIKNCYTAVCKEIDLCTCADTQHDACMALSDIIEYEMEKRTNRSLMKR